MTVAPRTTGIIDPRGLERQSNPRENGSQWLLRVLSDFLLVTFAYFCPLISLVSELSMQECNKRMCVRISALRMPNDPTAQTNASPYHTRDSSISEAVLLHDGWC